MSEHGDRAGAGPEGPGRRRPPSRRMRERADEMADLLAHAAPAVRANRRRRSAAIPAAVVALGALTIGGVGVAVGLDTETAGAVALPDGPASPADPGGQPIAPSEPATRNTSAVADVPVEPDDDRDDDSSSAAGDARPRLADPPAAAPHRPAAPARPPHATSGDDDGDDGDDGDEPHSSRTTTSSTSRTTTTSPRPTSTREADDGPSGSTTRSGRSTAPRSTDRPTGGLEGRSVVPDVSPTVDDE